MRVWKVGRIINRFFLCCLGGAEKMHILLVAIVVARPPETGVFQWV